MLEIDDSGNNKSVNIVVLFDIDLIIGHAMNRHLDNKGIFRELYLEVLNDLKAMSKLMMMMMMYVICEIDSIVLSNLDSNTKSMIMMMSYLLMVDHHFY